MKKNNASDKLFEKAKNVIPGGVNSPVRAFQSVGGNPLFIKSAKGAYLYDEDGNAFIDLINSWGPMILGHGHPKILKAVNEAIKDGLSFGAPIKKEVEMAELIVSMVPSIESVRMVNSGTEATMSAIRLARGYTNKSKIIKFEGCYHGHGDSFLIAAGSGAITTGTPNSAGVTKGAAKDTLLVPFNNILKLKEVIEQNKNEIAALILEPVAGNMGCIPPNKDYLQQIRKLCDDENIVLIFDEVMTGFRLASGGAQELYGVLPDLTTLGKIIGGGMPVGAYGGKKHIMNLVSPLGPVYQAGTLSGNPLAMSAGIAMLKQLNENKDIYTNLEKNTQRITSAIQEEIAKNNYPCTINQIGTMFTLFFSKEKCRDFEDAKKCDLALFSLFFQEMLSLGIYLPPSQFEAVFISTAIENIEIEKIIQATKTSLKVCFA